MKKIVLGLFGLLSLSIYAQDTTEIAEEFIPIEVEGKEAFISTKTGEYTYRAHKETNAEHLKTTPSGVVYTETIYHEVKKGETLFAIAKKNNTTVAQLKQSNKASALNLKPGAKLKIESKILLKSSSPVIGTSGEERIIAKLPPGESPGALAPPPPMEEIEKKLVKTKTSQEKPNQKVYKVKKSVKNPILDVEANSEVTNKVVNETTETKKERLARLKSEMAALEAELEETEATKSDVEEPLVEETETLINETIVEEPKANIKEDNGKKLMVFENNTEEEVTIHKETTAEKAARIIEEVRNTKKEQAESKSKITREKTESKVSFYTVEKGNSLWSIAKQHGMTVVEIKRLNALKNNNISVGQKLKVKPIAKQ
ncbi:LysM peptidoglycan-binding domain-containing protein [Lacinutrix sp. 5H-3-7-4]|uniref:LysM peptidoglycan-binding domain-containing protein n=1 Tax=Lacinutrix sp. (strain 5H-3-7-4) TaxID=983544 RepID=UPI00020A3E7B|nr:LysM peptidoglycan-binding domain-containing protein [Lacinutrix sp. 5H-3-7-4]AEH02511.1 Peptidoglycan-binding lysin domain protein [Lacinutrix sp. 5H-3-7-4]